MFARTVCYSNVIIACEQTFFVGSRLTMFDQFALMRTKLILVNSFYFIKMYINKCANIDQRSFKLYKFAATN